MPHVKMIIMSEKSIFVGRLSVLPPAVNDVMPRFYQQHTYNSHNSLFSGLTTSSLYKTQLIINIDTFERKSPNLWTFASYKLQNRV